MSTSAATPAAAADTADTPKGHPAGLYVLFATEMWERFSYYGMRALLVLYFVSYLGWQPSASSQVYKWYTSLVYLTPLLGGFIADRYLGLRASIIIGAILMSIGHFLMAFEPLPVLYTALAVLVAGNGFFKPNMSTLVGRLYGPNDKRRDGAFTIFYMGINVGASISPIVCGWLRANYGFHYGFAAAGVGMVIGLLIFLVGQGKVLEAVKAAGNDLRTVRQTERDDAARKSAGEKPAEDAITRDDRDAALPGVGGIAGLISRGLPLLMIATALLVPARFLYAFANGNARGSDLIMPIAFAGVAGWMGITLRTIKGASRDKSTVIFSLFFFCVLFWMAFEQAGNALSLWAEFHTSRRVLFFDFQAEYYQSVNGVFIVVLGPLFAGLWLLLVKKGIELSIPTKMAIAMVFMTLSFAAMVGAAVSENATVSTVPLKALPAGVDLTKINAGRMTFDAARGELSTRGVLPSYAVTAAIEPAVDAKYVASIAELEKQSKSASEKHPIDVKIGPLPTGFKLPLTDAQKSEMVANWDAATATLSMKSSIDIEVKNALLRAGAPADYSDALSALTEKSNAARTAGMWLFLSYFLATIGELCLSPVGLSMVTKLAPARFASLFMGVWLLASSVAQYVGGSLGESWGVITPTNYFNIFVWTSAIGAVVLFLLINPLKKLTHGVT